ncbi:MAG: glutamate--tRNA ligase family protein, partial [Bacteroidota bacterium]
PVPEIALKQTMGDFVIRKKDASAAYQIASLVDDLDYGINTIVRGEDLLGSTAAQLYLAELLGFLHFRREHTYYHHPLLSDGKGGKLSKTVGAASLKAMREAGLPPPGLANFPFARP